MGQARSDELTIRYDDLGHGEPAALCLPGWCASSAAFDDFGKRLGTKRRVLTLDWRGHGRSDTPQGDYDFAALVRDARAVIEASGARQLVPIATAHAGWVAIELRRALGADRIPKLVLIDWLVTPPPAPLLAALGALQRPADWEAARDKLFAMWLDGVDHPAVARFVRPGMGAYGHELWARSARAIRACY